MFVLLFLTQVPQFLLPQVRYLSGEKGGGRKGFLGEFLDNLKHELNKNKEMKENIKKFREEAKKLEESDALKQARRKYVSIQQHTKPPLSSKPFLLTYSSHICLFPEKY